MTKKSTTFEQSQLDKFKEAARGIGADEDEKHWDERMKNVVKAKPKPDQSPPD
jgi:hypothetical protein